MPFAGGNFIIAQMRLKKYNILFRCDGSTEIGMGHVVRCLALADELRENYACNITFAMRLSEIGIRKVRDTYPVIAADPYGFDYESWLTHCIYESNSTILVMDMRDGLTRESLRRIKESNKIKIITIDDPEDKRLETDLAFYPPVPQVMEMNWDDFEGELHVGWEYVILRREFSQAYLKPNNTIPNILVSMGGTDEKNMTRFAIEVLNLIETRFKTSIILGPGYQYRKDLENILAEASYENHIYEDPLNIAQIISESDLGIVSFGILAYELAALKVPAIHLCLTDDHFESSKLFMNEGIGVSMGEFSEMTQQQLVEVVLFHLTEKQILKEMSERASLLKISNIKKISSIINKNKIGEFLYG